MVFLVIDSSNGLVNSSQARTFLQPGSTSSQSATNGDMKSSMPVSSVTALSLQMCLELHCVWF